MEWIHLVFGHSQDELTWWQMIARGTILFGFAVGIIRLGGQRVFGKNTALDIIISVILGSNLSRAMTGNSPLIPTVAVTLALVLLHAGLTRLSCRFRSISTHLKGEEIQLIRDGERREDVMVAMGIASGDLEETMRLQGLRPDIDRIADAYLERNGKISILMREDAESDG